MPMSAMLLKKSNTLQRCSTRTSSSKSGKTQFSVEKNVVKNLGENTGAETPFRCVRCTGPGGMGLGRADQHPTLLEARVENLRKMG